MTKLFEAQEAMFKRLNEHVEYPVYDYVPEESKFPYVVLGRVYSTPERTKTTDGERIEATIDVWSRSKGKKETISIIKNIEAALSEDLTVEGAFLLDQKVNSREVLEEVSSLYHGTITFELLLDLE